MAELCFEARPIAIGQAFPGGVFGMEKEVGQRGFSAKDADIPLTRLKECVLTNAREDPIWVFRTGRGSIPVIRQWIESEFLQNAGIEFYLS